MYKYHMTILTGTLALCVKEYKNLQRWQKLIIFPLVGMIKIRYHSIYKEPVCILLLVLGVIMANLHAVLHL